MATIAHDHPLTVEPAVATPATAPAPGDPAILGLPIFVVGSIALGLSLVGYVPGAAAGSIVPVILAATGLGLVISTVWAAALGVYLFLNAADLATGGRGYPLGPALRR